MITCATSSPIIKARDAGLTLLKSLISKKTSIHSETEIRNSETDFMKWLDAVICSFETEPREAMKLLCSTYLKDKAKEVLETKAPEKQLREIISTDLLLGYLASLPDKEGGHYKLRDDLDNEWQRNRLDSNERPDLYDADIHGLKGRLEWLENINFDCNLAKIRDRLHALSHFAGPALLELYKSRTAISNDLILRTLQAIKIEPNDQFWTSWLKHNKKDGFNSLRLYLDKFPTLEFNQDFFDFLIAELSKETKNSTKNDDIYHIIAKFKTIPFNKDLVQQIATKINDSKIFNRGEYTYQSTHFKFLKILASMQDLKLESEPEIKEYLLELKQDWWTDYEAKELVVSLLKEKTVKPLKVF